MADVTRRGSVLPTPDDPRIAELIASWPGSWRTRGFWLTNLEAILREHYPQASSRDLNVTARSLAPFPLAEHDWTP